MVLEAHALGLPVVASARGGTPEVVEDGLTGLLYDPDQPDSLRSCLSRVIDQPGLLVRMSRTVAQLARGRTAEQLAESYVSGL